MTLTQLGVLDTIYYSAVINARRLSYGSWKPGPVELPVQVSLVDRFYCPNWLAHEIITYINHSRPQHWHSSIDPHLLRLSNHA